MKVFHLKFNKEADGDWYIDFPGYPLAHHNLMMVAGANKLCQYAAEKEGHPDYALVDVTTDDKHIDGREPDIVMTRVKKGYGATYHNRMPDGLPPFVQENEDVTRLEALEEHICLTLFLLLLAEVLDILEVGQLLDAEWHIVREATLIVGNSLLRQLADGLTRKDDVELHDLRRWLGAPVVPRLGRAEGLSRREADLEPEGE